MPGMQAKLIGTVVSQAARAWRDDGAQSMGAALAYYALFSIAPLLLIAISIAGLVFGRDAAEGRVVAELRGLMGPDGAAALQALLNSAARPGQGLLAGMLGSALLLVGAMGLLGELQDALDRIWRAPQASAPGLLAIVRSRLPALAMILGIGLLLIASLVASAAVSALAAWAGPSAAGFALVVEAANFALSFALLTATFAMVYKVMPRVPIEWHDVGVGAAITALLLTVGKVAIGLYIGSTGLASGFGAAASLIVVLVWMYYSAQIFLLGAEFTWVYAYTVGSLRSAAPPQLVARCAPTAAPDGLAALARSRAAIKDSLGSSLQARSVPPRRTLD